MKRTLVLRVVAVLAPLLYGFIAYGTIASHARLFDDRAHRDRVELEARLVERGLTAEQARALGAYEASASNAVASYVGGVGIACVGALMFVGVTLGSLIAAGRVDRAGVA